MFDADWYSSNDLDDGVRVWDGSRGVLDFGARRIRTIDLLPAATAGAVPQRLHGTVRTGQGDFTGFIQWNRNMGVSTDELSGRTANKNLRLRFDTLRSIARHMLGLWNGKPGARRWRQVWSDHRLKTLAPAAVAGLANQARRAGQVASTTPASASANAAA